MHKGPCSHLHCFGGYSFHSSWSKFADGNVTVCTSNPLNFGQGTQLTVLGKGESSKPPKVTIFSPSACELQKHQKATIVCLVTDFYPDHVSLTWSVNGEVRTEGVRTEDSRKEGTKTFSLISRLRISSNEWQNSGNRFQCSVEFYNEKGSSFYNASTTGVDGNGDVREEYLRETNSGKLVYILLILKSMLYGAFVMGLTLKEKGS